MFKDDTRNIFLQCGKESYFKTMDKENIISAVNAHDKFERRHHDVLIHVI